MLHWSLCFIGPTSPLQDGTLDTNYLRSRVTELPEQERIVVLMLDKVYTAQGVEYTNSSFIGVTEGASAKTVLTFMLQSVKGKYKDVVCLIPIHKLSTALLRKWFDMVMSALNDLFLLIIMFATGKMWFMLSQSYKKSYKIKKVVESFFAALLSITSIVYVNLNLFYCTVMLHVYNCF